MRFVSWNVNGLRACIKKGFLDYFNDIDVDFFCLQEIKMSEGQLDLELEGYETYYNYAQRKGYSGTAIFTIEEHDNEGRLITLEYDDFFLVTCYTPNSKQDLLRLDYRMVWEDAFRNYLLELNKTKSVIVCGDLNVAHKEIDLKNPKTNRKNAGFTDQEREKMSILLDSGFTDTFRFFYPDKENEYSWWSYFGKSREKNTGWRIDYFLTSKDMDDRLVDAQIHQSILGSDHCPVYLEIK